MYTRRVYSNAEKVGSEREGESETYRSIQNPLIALPLNIQLNISSITARDLRLRHEEGRPDLALKQWLQPLLFLLLVAVLRQDFHVACVRGGVVRRL